jgi:hypothetical protein
MLNVTSPKLCTDAILILLTGGIWEVFSHMTHVKIISVTDTDGCDCYIIFLLSGNKIKR